MVELRLEDLRFTSPEMTEFLQTVMSLDLSKSDLSILESNTEGWIAGLQMAGLSLQGRDNVSAFIKTFGGEDRHIFDFLIEEVIQRQTEDIQSFLLQSSILERVCAPLCDAITLREDSQLILDTLERKNLFLISLDRQRKWYRYHHLFSDSLKLMLGKSHPNLSPELHRRASRWYEEQGLLSDALDHALSSGDMKLVAQIVSINTLVLEENDSLLPTLKRIDALPLEKVTAQPWLGIARAWIYGSGQLQKAEQILNAIEKSIETASNNVESQRFNGHIAALRANLLMNKGDFANAIANACIAMELLPADEVAVRVRSLAAWGNALIGQQNMTASMRILEEALFIALQAGRPHIVINATSALANAYLIAGRLHDVERICQEALKVAEDYQEQTQHPLLATSEIYSLLSRILAEWGDIENAIRFAQQGVHLSRRWGQDFSESYCLCFLARALIYGNDLAGARQAFERADRITWKISKWAWQDRAKFHLVSLLDSDMTEPGEIDQLISRLRESGASLPVFITSRLQIRANRLDEALAALEKALSAPEWQPSYHTVRFHALHALALHVKGDEKQALVELRKALELGEVENRVATFVCEGVAMEKLLRIALVKKICPKFVQRLIAAFELRRMQKSVPTQGNMINKPILPKGENLIEPLTERELEILRLLNSHLSTPEIAELLAVSVNTVRTHIKSIYAKLGVHSRTAAIDVSKKLKLLA
jgi:LuxR family maltose regulon positive regulatory protein